MTVASRYRGNQRWLGRSVMHQDPVTGKVNHVISSPKSVYSRLIGDIEARTTSNIVCKYMDCNQEKISPYLMMKNFQCLKFIPAQITTNPGYSILAEIIVDYLGYFYTKWKTKIKGPRFSFVGINKS